MEGTVVKYLLLGLFAFSQCTVGSSLSWNYNYNGNDYYLTPSSTKDDYNWYDARSACMKDGGDLITIESQEESDWIKTITVSYYGNFWIGLNKLKGDWQWADGKTTPLKQWSSGEPDEGELCAYRYSRTSYYWGGDNCAEEKGMICKRPSGLSTRTPKTTLTTSIVGGYCPRGYVGTTTNRCYKVVGPLDSSLKWSAAREMCQDEENFRSDLACITDPEELVLISMIFAKPRQYLHIGLFRSSSTHAWKWVDNTPLKITNWKYTPSTYDYGCVYLDYTTGKWMISRGCTYYAKAYICQAYKDPSNVIPTPAPTSPHNCDPGYTPFGKGCYKIFTDNMKWEKATEVCENVGTHLVHIQDTEEAAAIQFMLYEQGVDKAWTGLRFNENAGQYEWSSNWYVTYTRWGPNQPKRGEDGGCVAVYKTDGDWYDQSCTLTIPAICKKTSDAPITPPPEKEGRCPNVDWTPIGSYCYKFCTSCYDDWLDQGEQCKKLHPEAHLASLHDFATVDMIYKKMRAISSSGSAWIGLYRSAKDQSWSWADGTPVQYTYFANKEPNEDPSSDEDCVYMYAGNLGKWYSYRCTYTRGYLCKTIKQPPLTTPTPINGSCPGDNWEKYGDTCFLYRPDEFATWDTALQHCIKEGGESARLAKISEYGINERIHGRMIEDTTFPQSRNFWIGLSRTSSAGSFAWLDGTNASLGFQHWGQDQPTDEYAHNCVQVNIGTSQWHNEKCTDLIGYVCEVPVVPYVTPPNTTPSDGKSDSGSLSGGAIAGIIIGVLIIVMLIGAGLIVGMKVYNGESIPGFNRPASAKGFDGPASVVDYERHVAGKGDI